jgi:hypothetical protein
MKKYLLLIFFVFPLLAGAQEFARNQFENEHYRSFTREEFVTRLGENGHRIPLYHCNGDHELDPYWMPRKNFKQDSLNVQFYKEEVKLTYRAGKFFDQREREVKNYNNAFFKYIKPVLKSLESIPETAKLLLMLQYSPFPLTIMLGNNSFNPKEENGANYRGIYMANAIALMDHGRMTSEIVPFYDVGVGGIIYWNPTDDELPGEVTLAHEMYHAADSIRGILDMRFVQGLGYESAMVSEYRAVFFENIVRESLNLNLRSHYSESSGPGLLDREGKPRFISAPCLKYNQTEY